MSQYRFRSIGLASDKLLNLGLRYAFIISLIIHLFAAAITALFFLKGRDEPDDFIYVDIIQATVPIKLRRVRLRTPREFASPQDIQLSSETQTLNWASLKPTIDRKLSQTNIALFSDAMVIPDINSIALSSSPSSLAGWSTGSAYGTASTTKLLKNRILISRAKIERPTKSIIPAVYRTINWMSSIDALSQPELPLEKIAKHLLTSIRKDKVDIVFIVDASQSMGNNIDAVINHLEKMIDIFQSGRLDFTIGVITFRYGTLYSMLGWDMRILPQTKDIKKIKQELSSIKCRGDERALDALMQSMAEVKFRKGAERRFILVTDEYVSGSYSAIEVLNQIQKFGIKVDVIGIDEPFQRMVAQRTGGLWFFIGKIDG